MRTRALLVLLTLGIGGCVTSLDASSYARVGQVHYPTERFVRNPAFTLPAGFSVTPDDVVARHGHLCRGRYNCTYFADGQAYYILQDYGVVPSLFVQSHAIAIVDGRTGALRKP
jgi:hypothetical protein